CLAGIIRPARTNARRNGATGVIHDTIRTEPRESCRGFCNRIRDLGIDLPRDPLRHRDTPAAADGSRPLLPGGRAPLRMGALPRRADADAQTVASVRGGRAADADGGQRRRGLGGDADRIRRRRADRRDRALLDGALRVAERRLASGGAWLRVAIVPGWMVLSEWRSGGGPPSGRVVAGLGLGLLGLGLLVGPEGFMGGGRVGLVGAAVLVLGGFAWAGGSI